MQMDVFVEFARRLTFVSIC